MIIANVEEMQNNKFSYLHFIMRVIICKQVGVLAHLVERFHGMEEATSSNLVHSTKNKKKPLVACFLFFKSGPRLQISCTPPFQ